MRFGRLFITYASATGSHLMIPGLVRKLLLQTQFVQDRMQAFVTHTQQLYLIGEAFQKLHRG